MAAFSSSPLSGRKIKGGRAGSPARKRTTPRPPTPDRRVRRRATSMPDAVASPAVRSLMKAATKAAALVSKRQQKDKAEFYRRAAFARRPGRSPAPMPIARNSAGRDFFDAKDHVVTIDNRSGLINKLIQQTRRCHPIGGDVEQALLAAQMLVIAAGGRTLEGWLEDTWEW